MSGWLTESTLRPRKHRPVIADVKAAAGNLRSMVDDARSKRGKKRSWKPIADQLAAQAGPPKKQFRAEDKSKLISEPGGLESGERNAERQQENAAEMSYEAYLAQLASGGESSKSKKGKRKHKRDKKSKPLRGVSSARSRKSRIEGKSSAAATKAEGSSSPHGGRPGSDAIAAAQGTTIDLKAPPLPSSSPSGDLAAKEQEIDGGGGRSKSMRSVVDEFGRRSKEKLPTVSEEYLKFKAEQAKEAARSGRL